MINKKSVKLIFLLIYVLMSFSVSAKIIQIYRHFLKTWTKWTTFWASLYICLRSNGSHSSHSPTTHLAIYIHQHTVHSEAVSAADAHGFRKDVHAAVGSKRRVVRSGRTLHLRQQDHHVDVVARAESNVRRSVQRERGRRRRVAGKVLRRSTWAHLRSASSEQTDWRSALIYVRIFERLCSLIDPVCEFVCVSLSAGLLHK